MARLRRFLIWPWAIHVVLGAALLLFLPSFLLGYQLDDHTHRMMSTTQFPSLTRGPTEYYNFFLDTPEFRASAREAGILPWYVDPEFHGSFWRPLSSLSLHLDHVIVDSAAFGHAQSLAWFAALILITAAIYRRLFDVGWLAVLAVVMFALDESHASAVGWIAARNGVMSMVFASAAVVLHLRWRQDGDLLAAVGAPAMLAIGLLSGETALAMTAYLFAYAVWLDRGSWRERVVSLLPCAGVSIVWRVVYVALGYGFGSSGMYIDPSADPLRFVAAIVWRLPALLSSQFTVVSADFVALVTGSGLWIYIGVGLSILVPCAVLAWPALREQRKLAGFFATGLVIAAIPMSATLPQERLLLPLGLGGFGLVAIVLRAAFWPGEDAEPSGAKTPLRLRVVGWIFVVTHLVIAPLTLAPKSLGIGVLGERYDVAARSLGAAGELEGKTVHFVRAADLFTGPMLAIHRASLGLDAPVKTRTLGSGVGAMTVTRIDARSLEVTCETGFLDQPLDRLLRDHELSPFRVGERVETSDGAITVTALGSDGRPTQIRFDAHEPLERDDNLWLVWAGTSYEPFELPSPGETKQLEPAPVEFSMGPDQ